MASIYRRQRVWSALALFLIPALLLLVVARPASAQNPPDPNPPRVIRIRTAPPYNADELIEQGIDVLPTRDEDNEQDLFALVTASEHTSLIADGWDVSVDREQTAIIQRAFLQPFQQGYHTVQEVEQVLKNAASDYPDLATLVDIGDSWERVQSGDETASTGHDLYALRLTNHATPGPKPVFFLMAAVHARELMSTEVALRFIGHVLESYGDDPLLTWILDEHEIVVVPLANPDGRVLVEQGYLHRKNTNSSYGDTCSDPPTELNHIGVDLNRNFAYQWGTVDTPDLDPCSQTFPGGTPASEPETQALQAFLLSLYPNHQPVAEGSAAPNDTTGVVISLHSYSDLVLWPWGHTYDLSPNTAGLQRLGEQMAAFADYEPRQAALFYRTSGTTDDWAYATLGIPSYTIEVGPDFGFCGGFTPPYSCLDESFGGAFWPRMRPALRYAAQVTRAPYTQPAGPHTSTRVTSDTRSLTLTVTLDGGSQPVAAAEVYTNTSPWQGGTPIPFTPLDGAFDSPQEQVQLVLPFSAAQQPDATFDDRVLLLVRAQNDQGTWGPVEAIWGFFPPAQANRTVWVPLVLGASSRP